MRKLVIVLTVLLSVSLVSLSLMYRQHIDIKRADLSYKSELSDLEKIITQLKEKNTDSLKQIEEDLKVINELKMVQPRIIEFENTIKSFNNQIISYENTIKSLNDQVSLSDARFNKLKIDYDNLIKEKQLLEVKFLGSTRTNRNLRDKLGELIHYIERIDGELNLVKSANKELRTQLADLEEKKNKLK